MCGFITATTIHVPIVLSTVLQMAGLGFTVGTLAIFLEDQVYFGPLFLFSVTVILHST